MRATLEISVNSGESQASGRISAGFRQEIVVRPRDFSTAGR